MENLARLALSIVIRAISVGAKALGKGSLVGYNHLNRKLDRLFETGWRRSFGWLGFGVGAFSYIYAPLHSLAINYDAVNVFLAFATGSFAIRTAEKVMLDRGPNATASPTGGLVNQAAIA